MPAIYTHYSLSEDVLNSLDKRISNKIIDSLDIYHQFAQSFDIFNLGKYKSSYFHSTNVNLYFKNIIKYIRDNELYTNSEILAYLYGSLCHYALDSTAHPFIFYYSGVYYCDKKETYKYKGKHTKMEYMIDAVFYNNKKHQSINKTDVSKFSPKVKYNKTLKKCIDYVFKETYQLEDMGQYTQIAANRYHKGIKYCMMDRLGIKRLFLFVLDKTNIFKSRVLHYYNYHIKKIDDSFMNLKHEKWCYPTNKELSYHYSFYDLYDMAIIKVKRWITDLDQVIDKSEDKIQKVLDDIGDLKYSTGLPCSKRGSMKYFKY